MKRNRITKPTLIRSSDLKTNSLIVRKSNKRIRKVGKNNTTDRFIRNAFGTPGRSIFCSV